MEERMKELVEKLVGWVDAHVDEIEKVHILKEHIGMTDEEIQGLENKEEKDMENRMKDLVFKLVGWVDSHVDESEKVRILKDHIGMTDEEIQEFGY